MLSLKNSPVEEEEKNFRILILDDTVAKSLIGWLLGRKKEAEESFTSLAGNAVFNEEHRIPAARAKGKVDALSEILARIEKIRR